MKKIMKTVSILFWGAMILYAGIALYGAVRSHYSVGVNNTDFSGWDRSGMTVHIDAKTGIQYLSRFGGLTVRLDAKGKPMKIGEK